MDETAALIIKVDSSNRVSGRVHDPLHTLPRALAQVCVQVPDLLFILLEAVGELTNNALMGNISYSPEQITQMKKDQEVRTN